METLEHCGNKAGFPAETGRKDRAIMQHDDENELRLRWFREVHSRVGQHGFSDGLADGRSQLQRLLDSIYRLHFLDPHFSKVQPPLPYLPALPLDERWVELTLSDGEENVPFARNRGLAELRPFISVARFLASTDSVIVVGEPGAGKSTMIKWSARYLISEIRNQSLIPLFVSLRSYARWRSQNDAGSILEYLALQHGVQPDTFADFIADVEIAGARRETNGGKPGMQQICRFLLDGWDEVPFAMRDAVADDIFRIQPLLPVVVTSRPSGYVTSLRIATRFQITPLSFESMRILMREWFTEAARPELELQLSLHLDNHPGFRELARNPFVLTLLCAVTARDWRSPIPCSRALLYERLFQLAQEYCNSEHRTRGYAWKSNVHSNDASDACAAAFETLSSESGGCRYQFDLASLHPPDRDGARIAELLNLSRLITLIHEGAEQWSFLHPTVHEFLAARHLTESNHGADLVAAALRPEWLQVMIFACGLSGNHPDQAVWKSLRQVAAKRDRFGLIALRLAAILKEVSCQDGGVELLGDDIRLELWRCFLEAPSQRAYATALMELDPYYPLQRLNELPHNPATISAVSLLQSMLPPSFHAGSELAEWLQRTSGSSQVCMILETDHDLPAQMGFHPFRSPNLTLASDTMTATEIVAKLELGLEPRLRRKYRIRLAATGGSLAERYLIEAMARTREPGEMLELSEALATLGTIAARDAILAKLRLLRPDSSDVAFAVTAQLLEALRGLPIHHPDALAIFELASNQSEPRLRVPAIWALSNCQDDRTLLCLMDLMRLSEPDVSVRRAAIEILMKNRAYKGVHVLLADGMQSRTDELERRLAWAYVQSSLAYFGNLPESPLHFTPAGLENVVLDFLRRDTTDPLHAFVASGCRVIRQNSAIAETLLGVAVGEQVSLQSRIAACNALTAMPVFDGLVQQITKAMQEISGQPEQQKLMEAVSGVLAVHAPQTLIHSSDPAIQRSLWQVALQRGLFVFADSVEDYSTRLVRNEHRPSTEKTDLFHSLRSVFHEQFQSQVMQYLKELHPTAQEVVLKHGDGGKDIVVYDVGRVYACYAPARIKDWNENDVIAKIRSDFQKAEMSLKSALKEWVLIHNHPQSALSNRISACVFELRDQNPGIRYLDVWGIEQLWNQLQRPRP